MTSLPLEGTSILVTGAGSGLGRALVDRFVAEGAGVTAFDRSAGKLKLLTGDHGDAVAVVEGDVTSFADNERACAAAVGQFGALDVWIGNAGLWDFSGSLADTPPALLEKGFDELFAVNVKGYLLGAKAALPALTQSRGSIVLTLSNAALYPGGGGPLYTASKHAGLGLVRQLAFELAPAVRVNGVAPGGMNTDLRGPASMGLADATIAQKMPIDDILRDTSALHIAPRPADYTGAYVLLASSRDSCTITGTVIDVSGVGTPARPL